MSDENKLLLRIATPKGVIYEKFVKTIKVKKKDGFMIINKNYSPVMEQLVNGNIEVKCGGTSQLLTFFGENSWLTVSDNRCHIYGTNVFLVE